MSDCQPASQMDTKNRFHLLDLLRLVAAFGVVFYHYCIYLDKQELGGLVKLCDFGYLGVNFFFMLSGFVIMASAENRSALRFALSRAQRLYPAFIACLLITLGVVWLAKGYLIPANQLLWNATLLNDYLRIPNIDGVYWTLQAELKFYGCIFLLSLLRILPLWRYWLTAWLGLAIVFHFTRQPFFMGWFINPEYSFYFIGGVCAYLLYKLPGNRLLQAILAVSLAFAVIKAGRQTQEFMTQVSSADRMVAQILVAVFFVFFYLLSLGKLNLRKVPWWWVYLGALSYPLYLIHNRAGKAVIEHFRGQIDIGWLLTIVIAGLLITCLAVHIGIEKPFNRLVKRWK
jgi:peptidoglycan/LPS O-acetylase OafA/YrhL